MKRSFNQPYKAAKEEQMGHARDKTPEMASPGKGKFCRVNDQGNKG